MKCRRALAGIVASLACLTSAQAQYQQTLYAMPAFASGGQAGLLGGLERRPPWQVMLLNPATLAREERREVIVVYDHRADNEGTWRNAGYRAAPGLPQALGMSLRVGPLELAAGASQLYNQRLHLLVTTVAHPDGEGTAKVDTRLDVVALEAAWRSTFTLPGLSGLRLGGGLGVTRMDYAVDYPGDLDAIRHRDLGLAWSCGVEGRLKTVRPLMLGLAWHKAGAARMDLSFSSQYHHVTSYSEGTPPSRLEALALWEPWPDGVLMANVTRVLWGRMHPNLSHSTEASLGYAHQVKAIRLALGASSREQHYNSDPGDWSYRAVLLEAGVSHAFGPLEASLTVLDGHWSRAAAWHQTHLSLGARYAF